jgi:hypothetical protein
MQSNSVEKDLIDACLHSTHLCIGWFQRHVIQHMWIQVARMEMAEQTRTNEICVCMCLGVKLWPHLYRSGEKERVNNAKVISIEEKQ